MDTQAWWEPAIIMWGEANPILPRAASADATQLIDNLILDPFHEGSHAYVTSLVSRFLPGVTRTETLGSHLFKWRMGVASLWFADIIQREALSPSS